MPARPCLTTGCPRLATTGSYCTHCTTTRNRQRNARRTHLNGDWPKVSRAIRDAWVAEHGWVCPGYQRGPHPSTDLTVDHITAGTRDDGLMVLCKSCNSRKGDR